MQVLDFNTGIDFGLTGNLKEFSRPASARGPTRSAPGAKAVRRAEFSGAAAAARSGDHGAGLSVSAGRRAAHQAGLLVYVNGLMVHFCSIMAPSEIAFMVSREIISPRANRLSFVLPNAISPSELNLGDDLRKLGLAFVKLSASQI